MGNWEQYLEENYDSDKEKAKKQRDRDKTEAREIAEKVSELYKESQEGANIKEYLTNGAILWCDKATLDNFVMKDGTVNKPLFG